MPDDSDLPPADAILLSEFLDPRRSEAVQQAQEHMLSQFSRLSEAAQQCTEKTSSEIRTAVTARRETCEELDGARRAAWEEQYGQLASGEWLAWGREGSVIGPWRRIPPEAWEHGKLRDVDMLEVRGTPPPKFYAVVVARQTRLRRGRPSYEKEDEPILREMLDMIRADPALPPYTAAMGLIEAGRPVAGGISTNESKAKRLAEAFRKFRG